MFAASGIGTIDDTDRREILGTMVDIYSLMKSDRNWCASTTGGIDKKFGKTVTAGIMLLLKK